MLAASAGMRSRSDPKNDGVSAMPSAHSRTAATVRAGNGPTAAWLRYDHSCVTGNSVRYVAVLVICATDLSSFSLKDERHFARGPTDNAVCAYLWAQALPTDSA